MVEHETFMLNALKLAELGKGRVSPNPLVGAVIVKDNKIIGQGYHEIYGGPHAEVNAINNCKESPKGATIYVSLEPCSHFGKTPPCADMIINSGVEKVVIAMEDPNPLVAGNGIKKLQNAGISVNVGICQPQAQKLNRSFIKYITTKMPFVISKYAMSLDGKIATSTYDSKWITQEETRNYSHSLLRSNVDAILVGIGTVLHDNPLLTNRSSGKSPLRVVVDTNGLIPLDSNIIKDTSVKTIIYSKSMDQAKKNMIEKQSHQVVIDNSPDSLISLDFVLSDLGSKKISSLLVEGGSEVNSSFWSNNLVDQFYIFIGNTIIGGKDAPGPIGGAGLIQVSEGQRYKIESVQTFKNNDILIIGCKGR